MNTGRTLTTKSFFTALMVAALLALSAQLGTMALDQMAGTQLTPSAAACQAGNGGGC